MPIGITQGALDQFGQTTMPLLPGVDFTYRESGLPGAPTQRVIGAWMRSTEDELALDVALRKRRTLRLVRTTFPNGPRLSAMLQEEPSGPLWEIKSLDGGRSRAFWFVHCQEAG